MGNFCQLLTELSAHNSDGVLSFQVFYYPILIILVGDQDMHEI